MAGLPERIGLPRDRRRRLSRELRCRCLRRVAPRIRTARLGHRPAPRPRLRQNGRRPRHPQLRIPCGQRTQPGLRCRSRDRRQRTGRRRSGSTRTTVSGHPSSSQTTTRVVPPPKSIASETIRGSSRSCCPFAGTRPTATCATIPSSKQPHVTDLAILIAFGGATGLPPTATGWPSTYVEEYVDAGAIFQSQVNSLIFEGAFDRFPTLRVVLSESGWTWMPSLMWRMDKEWKGLRRDTPWVKRRPSEYMREHIRLTTAPTDRPSPERAERTGRNDRLS